MPDKTAFLSTSYVGITCSNYNVRSYREQFIYFLTPQNLAQQYLIEFNVDEDVQETAGYSKQAFRKEVFAGDKDLGKIITQVEF